MKGLGKDFNVVAVASGLHVSLKNASGVTFIVYEATTATTLTFLQSIAGASGAALNLTYPYHAGGGVGGVWTAVAALAVATNVVTKGAGAGANCAVVYVGADDLSDGYDSVECTVSGGTCCAIVHGLLVQRDPVNLPISAV